jgi:hypothetical protein
MALMLHCTTCVCELAVSKQDESTVCASVVDLLPQLQEVDIPVPGDGQALMKMTSR